MPRYAARLHRDPDGSWVASALEFPHCWSRGRTREEAVHKLAQEVRYRIEYCPCTGVADDFVDIEIVNEGRDTGADPPVRPAAGWGGGRSVHSAPLAGVAGCPGPARTPDSDPSNKPHGAATAAESSASASGTRRGWRRWDD